MKKIFLLVAMLFALPSLGFAAVTADNFDSYSNGASVADMNTGVGWKSPWLVASADAGPSVWNTDIAPLGGQGGLALHGSSVGYLHFAQRMINPVSSGVFHFEFNYSSGAQGEIASIQLNDTANTGNGVSGNRLGIAMNATGSGALDVGNGHGFIYTIGSFVPNTWNTIDIKFDSALGEAFQVSINGGPYSSDIMGGGNLSHLDQFSMYTSTTLPHDFWVDNITITSPDPLPPPPPSYLVNRLTKFVTSTSIGEALFSDDGTNTTLTSGNLYLQIGSVIDTIMSGVLNFGTTMASAINIGHIGMTTTLPGTVAVGSLTTTTNCISSVSPAVCNTAPSGSVALSKNKTTLAVNTTAITANSQIFIQEDSSLGSRLGITCDTKSQRTYTVSARTPGASFTIESSDSPSKNKACLSYWVVN